MAKSPSQENSLSVPPVSLWNSPLAWVDSPLRPASCFGGDFPATALFVRGEALLTLAETIGPGMTRQTEQALPALIQLTRGVANEVHFPGPDGLCWTYRRRGNGRRARWSLFTGPTFPAQEQAGDHHEGVVSVVVRSVLPMDGTRRFISFAIGDQGRMDDFSNANDPDPND